MSEPAEWLSQAERDLEVGRHLVGAGFNEWAAYAAQQAAEKAVKALRIALGTEIDQIKVHGLSRLVGTIPQLAPWPEWDKVAELDLHNQASRYPGLRGEKGEAPHKTYNKVVAEETLSNAEGIVRRSSELLAQVDGFWKARARDSTGA